jgi:hypothetical protein
VEAALFLFKAMKTGPTKKGLLRIGWWLWNAAQIALLVFGTFIVADSVGNPYNIPSLLIFYGAFFLVIVGWVFVVAVHEFGHVAAAWLGGWKIAVVAVQGLTIWPMQRRARFGLPGFPGLGGATLPIPPEAGNWRGSYVAMLLGGPIANLVLAICLLLVVLILPKSRFWTPYLEVIAAISALTFAINLLPLSKGPWKFDGARIAMALRGQDLEPWARVIRVSAEMTTPKRPRDWNPYYVEAVKQDFVTGHGEGALGLLLCQYYLDHGDIGAARAALAWAAERLGEIDHIRISEAFMLAHFDKDIQGAEALLAKIKSRTLKKQPAYLISRAVIASHTGDGQFFSAAVDRATAALKRAPFATSGDFEFLEELIGKSRNSAQAGEAPSAS